MDKRKINTLICVITSVVTWIVLRYIDVDISVIRVITVLFLIWGLWTVITHKNISPKEIKFMGYKYPKNKLICGIVILGIGVFGAFVCLLDFIW